jgi:disease resistance protein RPM1
MPFSEDTDSGELGYLTELRVLNFSLPSSYPPGKLLILMESLGKLRKLQHININILGGEKIDNLGDWVPSSPQLCSLQLNWWYETMPTWITTSLLPLIFWLDISVHQVRLEDIQVLGTLPALRIVSVSSEVDTATEEERAGERSFMLSTDAFPRAISCFFQHVIFAPYMIPPGAMPMVDDLSFGLLVSDILNDGDWDLCIRNLPSLKGVGITLYGEEESSERYVEAKAAVERAVADHPNRPEATIM